MYKFIFTVLAVMLFLHCPSTGNAVQAANRVQDTGEKIVIVIDPGHGGKNQGTIAGDTDEKIMTLVTAQAMYDELLKYNGIQVFMTRTDDRDLTLKERAEFAADVEADFLFSIHYNASEYHEFYGSEVWVSSFSPYNAYGYQFGYEFLTQMREWGLFNRGVKTRLNASGEDYYGIIREAVNLEVPALIIEHCHVDEAHDIEFCNSEEDWKAFGVADATAVAKYFGLKSDILKVDYSDYELAAVDASELVEHTVLDETEPDVCHLDMVSADYDEGTLQLVVSAMDYDSPIMYYTYSLDGGETYSVREPWPGCNTLTGVCQNALTLYLDIPDGIQPNVIVRAYNMYDLYTDSNAFEAKLTFQRASSDSVTNVEDSSDTDDKSNTSSAEAEDTAKYSDKETHATHADEMKHFTLWDIIKLILVAAIIILSMIVVCQLVVYNSTQKLRKRQRKNELGDETYQIK